MRQSSPPPSADFLRAWRAWLQTEPPTDNFRHARHQTLSYGIELDLDHLSSSLYTLGVAFIGRESFNFPKLASEELTSLDEIASRVRSDYVSEPERARAESYVALCRTLLNEMVKHGRTDE